MNIFTLVRYGCYPSPWKCIVCQRACDKNETSERSCYHWQNFRTTEISLWIPWLIWNRCARRMCTIFQYKVKRGEMKKKKKMWFFSISVAIKVGSSSDIPTSKWMCRNSNGDRQTMTKVLIFFLSTSIRTEWVWRQNMSNSFEWFWSV